MMMLVYADFTKQRERYRRSEPYLIIGIAVLSAIVAFVPINQYGPCYVGDYQLYCGFCFKDPDLGLLNMLFYIIPSVLGIPLAVYLCKVRAKLKPRLNEYEELTEDEK